MSGQFAIAGAAVLVLAVSVARGAHPDRRVGRFDDRIVPFKGAAIGVAPRAIAILDPSDPVRSGWEGFRDRHDGAWQVYLDERTGLPTLVSGRGIAWFDEKSGEPSLQQLEARARQFLAAERALLGEWGSVLELDSGASGTLRRGYQQVVFRQRVDGVRVENARFEFHVNRGRLVMFGATHWGVPRASGVPTVGVIGARVALDTHLAVADGVLIEARKPELVMLAVDAELTSLEPRAWNGPRGNGLEHVLFWRFAFRYPGEEALWVGEVDAHDGSLRSFYDGTSYAAVQGGIFPVSADGDCAAGGCEIARFPLPFADYTETDQAEMFTDEYGFLQCVDEAASFEVALSGPYVHIEDACGPVSEAGTCEAGVDLGTKHGENCDVEPGRSPGNSAAARTTYYHINRAAEVARFHDPGNEWLDSPLTVNVNDDGTCNAFWSGEITMYGGGDGCANMGELQGVLVHEWGHGYDHNDGGGMDSPGEAYADIMALFAGRDHCVSRGWYVDGRTCEGWGNPCLTCTGVRGHDWAEREWNMPATASNFLLTQCPGDFSPFAGPCNRQPHCESYLLGETFYDFVTRDLTAAGLDIDTAWQLAERLWYTTRLGSGGDMYFCILPNISSCGASSLYQKLRVADDDDGDLSNGTPHAAALYAAFDRHDMACGSAAAPENQSNSSCPELDTPEVTVEETPSGTNLSWNPVSGTGEIRVYRGDLGCDRQQVPIASLTAGETSLLDTVSDPELPRYYRIEALGVNPACSSAVSNCAATPSGARLQASGHRIVEPGPVINEIPDPGETVQLPVTLFNSGLDDALGVQGSLSLVDSTQGHVLDPEATWADVPSSETLESDAPHFEFTVFEDVSCGDLLAFDLEMWGSNAALQTHRIYFQLGDPARDFLNDTNVTIPAETIEPATSTIEIEQDMTITELDVTVGISHSVDTELIVELTSPQGTTVRLHDQSSVPGFGIHVRYDLERDPDGPGTMDDFVGESTLGSWTLSIEDVGTESTGDGTLVDWTLHIDVAEGFDCIPHSCSDPVPTIAPELQIARYDDGAQAELVFTWTEVPLADGYRVLRSPAGSFDSDVELIGTTTANVTTFSIDDTTDGEPPLTFYQVRGVNSCGQEGP